MPFPAQAASQLIARCHRRCCICHRFCGVKMELDHIVPKADGGTDDIENAIPVCFECHAEIHSYNDCHPRGRKFRPEELRLHKEQWLQICADQPSALFDARADNSVGPIAALIDELEFNRQVAKHAEPQFLGSLFMDEQFRRAVHDGVISILSPELKEQIIEAYVQINRANQLISKAFTHAEGTGNNLQYRKGASSGIWSTQGAIDKAHAALLKFLTSDP